MSLRVRAAAWAAALACACAPIAVARPGLAVAATGGQGWTIGAIGQPTYFSPAHASTCEVGVAVTKHCDRYTLLVTNAGDSSRPGPVTITDTLGSGVSLPTMRRGESVHARNFATAEEVPSGSHPNLSCETEPVIKCTDKGPVAAGDILEVVLEVVASGSDSPVQSSATVEEGGEVVAQASTSTAVSSESPGFGLQDFALEPIAANADPDLQAGGHPYSLTTSFDFTSIFKAAGAKEETLNPVLPAQDAKQIVETLPLGFLSSPLATPRCPEVDLGNGGQQGSAGQSTCPADTQIGVVTVNFEGDYKESSVNPESGISPVYNVIPEAGYPAELGFDIDGHQFVLYASIVRTPAGYGLRVAGTVPMAFHVDGLRLTLWGTPGEAGHDPLREQLSPTGGEEHEVVWPTGTPIAPYLTSPTDCAGPIKARMEADSWAQPEDWISAESTSYPSLEGCDWLSFEPELELAPEANEGPDEPSGYSVTLEVPQASAQAATVTPDLRDASVTLPAGVSLSPSVATGLVGCPATGPEGLNAGSSDIGPRGEDLGDPQATELGEGHSGRSGDSSPYDDGLYHLAPGHCPSASQIGDVSLQTPLLQEALRGHIYLARSQCGNAGQAACTEAEAEEGRAFGIYLEAAASGTIIKLSAAIEAGGYGAHSLQTGLAPGQLRVVFDEDPQLPLSELKLTFDGGQRAPLANPQTCGAYAASMSALAWGGASPFPSASPSFGIVGCAGATPFAPGFTAGTSSAAAGAYTGFSTTFSRTEGQQDLGGITLSTPPGLLAMISRIPLCAEAQANAGTCAAASQIGTVIMTVGAGSEPYPLHGSVYLTGSYGGQPFGLSIVVPVVAGPFDLGTEVVRASIAIAPNTAALTIAATSLPQLKDGLALGLQTMSIDIDRPEFILNPTDCAGQALSATISATGGATAGASTPFAVAGCSALSFTPTLTASTQGAARLNKQGASLDVKISPEPGQANLKRIDMQLPTKLPARLSTLQHACTEAEFDAAPSDCPASSIVGSAIAVTPILDEELQGPAYFVSRGGLAFPDLELVLQGQGVTIVLTGSTEIENGITYSRFETIPDAPISSFELDLPEQGNSALASPGGSLCGRSLTMPTTIEGQNGAVVRHQTKVTVTGCRSALQVDSHRVSRDRATVTVTVPSAGRLTASGKGLPKASRRTSKPKLVTLDLRLTRAEASRLDKAHGAGRRRKIKLTLTFSPPSGGRLSKTVTLSFRGHAKRAVRR